jgi:predicted transport protein
MGDLKLFRLEGVGATELAGTAVHVEKSLQDLIERHLEVFLAVRFLKSEHVTGKVHGGRIDTLGLDENDSPVIVEYKRSTNENVINQGLFYLDWLLDHRAEFQLLVMNLLGADVAERIDWSFPRLICIAGNFTRYDEHAVQQMGRNIELIRYRQFGEDLLALEQVNAPKNLGSGGTASGHKPAQTAAAAKTVTDYLAQAPASLRQLYDDLQAFVVSLGDDVQEKTTKYYVAFRRLRNFACVEVHPQAHELLVFAKLDPDSIRLEAGFTRDVRQIGHFGTGDVEIRVKDREMLECAKPLVQASYEAS